MSVIYRIGYNAYQRRIYKSDYDNGTEESIYTNIWFCDIIIKNTWG